MSIPLPEALTTNRFISAELRPNSIESESEIELSSGFGSLSESTLNQVLERPYMITSRYEPDRSTNSNYSNDPYLFNMNPKKNAQNQIKKILEYNNLSNNNQNLNESNGSRSFAIEARKFIESPL